MTDLVLLRSLGYILVAAAVVVVLAARLRIPSIVAYLGAGLLLGPMTGLITVGEEIHLISEVGIALLLFLVGLELSLDKIRDVGRVAVLAGLGQVVFTAAGGLVIALLLGFEFIESLFLATALTFSSTVVVVKLLDQKKEIDALYGRIAVGIFLVQDLVVIVALTFLAGLGDPEALTPAGMGIGLVKAFAGMGLLLGAALVAARYLLPRVFAWVASSSEAMLIWSLCWCFLFVIGAEVLALSLEIGAFLAGLSLAQLPYNHDLRRRVHPLMNSFLAVFFVSLGVQMEFGGAAEHALSAVVLSLFVLVGNPFIFMWIIARTGYGERTSFLTSVTVAQISEFSFIFAAMGLASGLIDQSLLSLIGVIGLVTIGVSSYMILYNHELYRIVSGWGMLRFFKASQEEDEEPPGRPRNHIIVVGMNALGRYLVRQLADRGEDVMAVDTDPGKLEGLPGRSLLGSAEYYSTLEEANLPEARLLVSALQIEDTNNLLAYWCRNLGVPSSIHAFDRSVIDELNDIGVNHLMISKNIGIQRIAGELRRQGVLN
ncbi:MAG: cation:proton antiporter [Gemmatimonadetes bacterium]|nr:cation:proton antiporter [Gemmatimonadota bacterium]